MGCLILGFVFHTNSEILTDVSTDAANRKGKVGTDVL